jgi:hypothetical protein
MESILGLKPFAAMKRAYKRRKAKANVEFTLVEKLTVIYLGLYTAKEIFFSASDSAFLQNKITSKEKKEWEYFFIHEYELCSRIDIGTYEGCTWLEFKVRHLMDLAMNISFDSVAIWNAYTVSFENIFFPFLQDGFHKNN